MKKFQKRTQIILISIISKDYLVHNGKQFFLIRVKSSIVGFRFSSFIFTKRSIKNK